MAKLLAIEWDAREARVAVAQSRGREITLENAFAVPLGSETATDGGSVGQRIAAAFEARSIARGELLVGVGRASIELKQMSLPPAPDDELPEMVRFQAMRQFTTISDDWSLDYVPLHSDESGTQVLAAAISPAMLDQIRTTCKDCELAPKRLVLRPFAAASLLTRQDKDLQLPPRLMVDILTDEADLTVLADRQVALMRTVRLPAATLDTVQSKSMLGEIRRTIAAAQNQMKGRRVERIVLCGNGSDQSTLKELIEQELNLEVEFFDPFESVKQRRELADSLPEHVGRFAPLIGMLVDEACGESHAVDFLHPRRKPEPPSNKRRNILLAATAAALALAAGLMIWFQLSALDSDNRLLADTKASLQEAVETANQHKADLQSVQKFFDGDVLWLEELYELCSLAPDPQSEDRTKPFLITSITLASSSEGGEIVVEGYSREPRGIEELHSDLLASGFEVIPGPNREDKSRDEYRWSFSDRYRIKKDGKQQNGG